MKGLKGKSLSTNCENCVFDEIKTSIVNRLIEINFLESNLRVAGASPGFFSHQTTELMDVLVSAIFSPSEVTFLVSGVFQRGQL